LHLSSIPGAVKLIYIENTLQDSFDMSCHIEM